MAHWVRDRWEDLFAVLMLGLFLGLGLFIYPDYGVPWDELSQRYIGQMNLAYVNGESSELLTHPDRFHGPVFEMLLVAVENVFFPAASLDVILLRHLTVFLTFFLGAVFFYLLSKNIFRQKATALLCAAALILSPRIFDNAFYNSKDIPLLVCFIVCFFLLFQYLDSGRRLTLALLAVFSAATVSIRVSGLLIMALAAGAVMLTHLRSASVPPGRRAVRILGDLALLAALFAGCTVLFWPVLWQDPLKNLLLGLQDASRFAWNHPVLFQGKWYPAADLPATYPIVWIAITTPVVYLALFLTGAAFLVYDTAAAPRQILTIPRLKLYSVAAWFFLPLALVIALDSVLYDTWRHLFFLYPALLLLAFWGFERVLAWSGRHFRQSIVPRAALYGLVLLAFALTAAFIVRSHPYQQIYFNALAGRNLAEAGAKYDLDYWGLSYRRGLEYINQTDPGPEIPFTAETAPGFFTFVLPEADQARFVPVQDRGEAKYYLTSYRYDRSVPPYTEVYAVEIEGVKIMSVFRLR